MGGQGKALEVGGAVQQGCRHPWICGLTLLAKVCTLS